MREIADYGLFRSGSAGLLGERSGAPPTRRSLAEVSGLCHGQRPLNGIGSEGDGGMRMRTMVDQIPLTIKEMLTDMAERRMVLSATQRELVRAGKPHAGIDCPRLRAKGE